MPEFQSYRAPRGTDDILPDVQPYWRWVRETATRVATAYGYREIETPVFEHAGVFLRPGSEGTDLADKEVYLFEDRGGDRLALRPEGTAAIVRAFLEHGMSSWPQPVRLFYVQPNFRYDRPQAGRYRLHHQFGIEAIGESDASIDAEVIELQSSFFRALGLTGVNLSLNSIGDGACRPQYVEKLRAYYADKLDRVCGDCRRRYEINPLRLLDCKNEPCQPFKAAAPHIADHLCQACSDHFQRLQSLLTALDIPFSIEPTLVRGLDYYTRTAFEFQPAVEGSQSALGGGGRYDGLIQQLGGPPTPAIGFGTGLERVILNLRSQGLQPEPAATADAFIAVATEAAQGTVMQIARELRQDGLQIVVGASGRSLRAQLRHANAIAARYAVVVGEQEIATGQLSLRDLVTGEQEQVTQEGLLARLRL